MRSVTRAIVFAILGAIFGAIAGNAESLREVTVRKAALKAGLVPAEDLRVPVPRDLADAGKLLFESKALSLDRETACASCHRDRFGSSDGLPNAFGTKAKGAGPARLAGGGDIIPRKTLPFWGRGGVGFEVFFWDGKVERTPEDVRSQFGTDAPSNDPLVVAAHLPPVEIGEMISDTRGNDALEGESVIAAYYVYTLIRDRVRGDPDLSGPLALARGRDARTLEFIDISEAIAAFIRDNFAVRTTRFHDFVFNNQPISPRELEGALIFYGKGHCSNCHYGPYFSDMDFHAIPFPQAGFGKNGFGVDYGRYNVTMDPADLYKFRTPPLFNVTKTAPYSHSGSIVTLSDAIRAHLDPLAVYDPTEMTGLARAEFYARLKAWAGEPLDPAYLADDELTKLIAFLGTLEYESRQSVKEVD